MYKAMNSFKKFHTQQIKIQNPRHIKAFFFPSKTFLSGKKFPRSTTTSRILFFAPPKITYSSQRNSLNVWFFITAKLWTNFSKFLKSNFLAVINIKAHRKNLLSPARSQNYPLCERKKRKKNTRAAGLIERGGIKG